MKRESSLILSVCLDSDILKKRIGLKVDSFMFGSKVLLKVLFNF